MTTEQTISTATDLTLILAEERAHAKKGAMARNMVQIGAELFDEYHAIVWKVRISEDGKTAKLSRATLIARHDGGKGYSLRGAMKPITFRFDGKGNITALKGETQERIALLQSWGYSLVKQYLKGLHTISNASGIEDYKYVRGFNGFRNEKFKTFIKRFNGKNPTDNDSAYENTHIANTVDMIGE
jgi:hypothetical protein